MSVTIVLHCSASGFGNAALIAKWHTVERGWRGIGYHYVILNGWLSAARYHPEFDGHIETGRALDSDPFISTDEIGAHVRGYNRSSVGICLIGRSGEFTEQQLRAAAECIERLKCQFGTIDFVQHSDLDNSKPHCAGLTEEQIQRIHPAPSINQKKSGGPYDPPLM